MQSRIEIDAYNLLMESMLNGRIDLNYPYDYSPVTQEDIDKLENLDNYKDMSERREKDVVHYYDLAFYNGKYYCYFGIVPLLTVMLPIAVFTGVIPYSSIICFIYAQISMIIILLLYLEILKRIKIKLNFISELLVYISLLFITGLPYLMTHPTMYEAAQICGLTWGVIGIYSLLKLDNNKKVLRKLFIAGLSFGLMVCSRAIYVLYFPIYLILAYKYLVKDKKINIKNILSFALPVTVCAILQMIYNYVRFDNIFEFGQFYQLTINDPSLQKFDIGTSISGVLAYLFTLPTFDFVYPYMHSTYTKLANGNLIFELRICGLVCYPFFWNLFFGGKILKENKQLKWLLRAVIIIMISILAINTCFAGINQRYDVDIQPCMALMSLTIFCYYMKQYNCDQRSKRLLICLSIISCIVAILIDIPKVSWDLVDVKGIELPYIIKHAVTFFQ